MFLSVLLHTYLMVHKNRCNGTVEPLAGPRPKRTQYVGLWHEGVPHGACIVLCTVWRPPMPTIFTGHGARSYRDGSSFEGDFFTGACTLYRTLDTAMSLKLSLARMAGKRHGNGRLVYPNGDTFEVGKDHRRRCCLAVLELFLVLTGNLP